jgi:hypothetical protein
MLRTAATCPRVAAGTPGRRQIGRAACKMNRKGRTKENRFQGGLPPAAPFHGLRPAAGWGTTASGDVVGLEWRHWAGLQATHEMDRKGTRREIGFRTVCRPPRLFTASAQRRGWGTAASGDTGSGLRDRASLQAAREMNRKGARRETGFRAACRLMRLSRPPPGGGLGHCGQRQHAPG